MAHKLTLADISLRLGSLPSTLTPPVTVLITLVVRHWGGYRVTILRLTQYLPILRLQCYAILPVLLGAHTMSAYVFGVYRVIPAGTRAVLMLCNLVAVPVRLTTPLLLTLTTRPVLTLVVSLSSLSVFLV